MAMSRPPEITPYLLSSFLFNEKSSKPTAGLKHRITRDPQFNYKYLKLSGRDLVDLPPGIFQVTDLEYLDFSPERQSGLLFHLASVPPQIQELQNLRVLCLDTNELRNVPVEVGNLVNLEILVLSNNLLTSLPGDLKGLVSLKSLHLANNFLCEVPNFIFSLKNLEFLELSDNKIATISEDIVNLESLEVLHLLYNLLQKLPENIVTCSNLRSLWLGNNRLRSLPRKFGQLKKLDWTRYMHSCNISGNPLTEPPMEICVQGLSAIEIYFKKREAMETAESIEVD